jgi:hypothetical protein
MEKKEFLSEEDLDEIGFGSRATRARWRKQGLLKPAIKIGGPNGKGLTPREVIDAFKATSNSTNE